MTKKDTVKKIQTDVDVKRKAVKLVIAHLKKKLPPETAGLEHIISWISSMDNMLEEETFDVKQYLQMRKELNDIIERTLDEETRFKLRDSWYSLGKALAKKIEQK